MPQTMARQTKSLTGTIVEKLADANGVDVYQVPPLIESVDPDALEKLFTESEAADAVTIEFSHAGHRIVVDGGRVSIDPGADGA